MIVQQLFVKMQRCWASTMVMYTKEKPKNSSKPDLKRSFSSTSSLTKHTTKEEDERSIGYYLKTINSNWSNFCLDE